MSLKFIVVDSLVDILSYLAHTLGGIVRIEMNAWHAVSDKVASLLGAPLYAHLLCGIVVGAAAEFRCKFAWKIYMENLWQHSELVAIDYWLHSRHNGHGDSGSTAAVNEIVVFTVVEKHLSDDVACTEIDFVFEISEVDVGIWSFVVLLGVSSHAVGEFVVAHDVNFGAIGKKSVVEGIHLLLKLIGERMTVLHRHKAVPWSEV